MPMNRPMLVVACSGLAASMALAGPRDPQVNGNSHKKTQAARQVQLHNGAATRVEPINYVRVKKMPNGQVVAVGPVMPYTPINTHGDDPTLAAFDLCQFDPTTGAPVGGECANPAAPNASSRWWFGAAALNAHFVNDFTVEPGTQNKPFDRIDHAWNWGAGAVRPMWIGLFIDDTFNTCAVGTPPSAGEIDGVAYQFADAAGGGGYYYTNLGLPPDPAENILAPADGNGAYEMLYGVYDVGTNTFTLDIVPGTQPMLWGENVVQAGTQGPNQWDDDTPQDGLWIAAECYNYSYVGQIPCPADGILGGMISFWVDPAGGGGCYANCDQSTGTPQLTANDFQCFINAYAANDPYANCDGSTGTPQLTANDFQCFINEYAGGCP